MTRLWIEFKFGLGSIATLFVSDLVLVSALGLGVAALDYESEIVCLFLVAVGALETAVV